MVNQRPRPTEQGTPSSNLHWAVLASILVVATFVLVKSAWVSEDAYITFRTSANLVRGFGPRWNVAERVQSFTNPLWMLIMSGAFAIFGEVFFSSIVLSLFFSLSAISIGTGKLAGSSWGAILFAAVTLSSKAFVDYSTSGLENALGYALAAAFLFVLFQDKPSLASLTKLTLLTTLAALTRMDTVLLYAPALVYWAIRSYKQQIPVSALLARMLLGFSPLIFWILFATFYYGFPFPNTAYAKIHTGIPSVSLFRQGLLYMYETLTRDTITLGAIGMALLLGIASKENAVRMIAAGIALYLIYTLRVGGDFMLGRFLALPLLMAAVLISRIQTGSIAWTGALIITLALGFYVATPTWLYSSDDIDKAASNGVADERGFYNDCCGLLHVAAVGGHPDCSWVLEARAYDPADGNVTVRQNIGLFGFYAKPELHIIDVFALSDPLLARMEIPDKNNWRIGHFQRRLPEGYVETVRTGKNVIEDPKLHELYSILETLTRGPLWSWERIREIARINLGYYDDLLHQY